MKRSEEKSELLHLDETSHLLTEFDGCASPCPVMVIPGADEQDGPYLEQMGPPPLLQKADVFSTHSLSAPASSHLLGNMTGNKSKEVASSSA
ncbi:hypothetical protein R3I94_005269 [Phoxinus phoxinus]